MISKFFSKRGFILLFSLLFLLLSSSLGFGEPAGEGLFAEMKTNMGTITLRLFFKKTPKTVANFVGLAEGTKEWTDFRTGNPMNKPLYKNLKFHRVIDNFMVQGGDPLGNGRGGPGYRFDDEFHTDLTHSKPGILSMANAGPNTNGSQFFITHVPTPWLDGKHTVFGEVVSGMDVVNSIKKNDDLIKINILRKGNAAKAFNK